MILSLIGYSLLLFPFYFRRAQSSTQAPSAFYSDSGPPSSLFSSPLSSPKRTSPKRTTVRSSTSVRTALPTSVPTYVRPWLHASLPVRELLAPRGYRWGARRLPWLSTPSLAAWLFLWYAPRLPASARTTASATWGESKALSVWKQPSDALFYHWKICDQENRRSIK